MRNIVYFTYVDMFSSKEKKNLMTLVEYFNIQIVQIAFRKDSNP